jgi:hypothetical protein
VHAGRKKKNETNITKTTIKARAKRNGYFSNNGKWPGRDSNSRNGFSFLLKETPAKERGLLWLFWFSILGHYVSVMGYKVLINGRFERFRPILGSK